MLVLCVAEHLRSLVLLLHGFITYTLGAVGRLQRVAVTIVYSTRATKREDGLTFSALPSSFSADFRDLLTCATCFSAAAASLANVFLSFFAEPAVMAGGALDTFMLVAPSMLSSLSQSSMQSLVLLVPLTMLGSS